MVYQTRLHGSGLVGLREDILSKIGHQYSDQGAQSYMEIWGADSQHRLFGYLDSYIVSMCFLCMAQMPYIVSCHCMAQIAPDAKISSDLLSCDHASNTPILFGRFKIFRWKLGTELQNMAKCHVKVIVLFVTLAFGV